MISHANLKYTKMENLNPIVLTFYDIVLTKASVFNYMCKAKGEFPIGAFLLKIIFILNEKEVDFINMTHKKCCFQYIVCPENVQPFPNH